VDVAQPIARQLTQHRRPVHVGVAGQVSLIIRNHGDIQLPRRDHAADRHNRRAEQVDQVRLERIEMLANRRVRDGDARLRRLRNAHRRQRHHLDIAHRVRRNVGREHNHVAPRLLEIVHRQVGCLRYAIHLRQKRLCEDGDSLHRRERYAGVWGTKGDFVAEGAFCLCDREICKSFK
jgi:hypothetical protein